MNVLKVPAHANKSVKTLLESISVSVDVDIDPLMLRAEGVQVSGNSMQIYI